MNKQKNYVKSPYKKNPYAIKFVNEQTEELCKIAIQKNSETIKCIKNPTLKLYKLAYQREIKKQLNLLMNKQRNYVKFIYKNN
jgi:hypothetical protein